MSSTPQPPNMDVEASRRAGVDAGALKGAGDAPSPAVPAHDRVHDNGLDSFPASDPPAWWSGRDIAPSA